MRLAFALLLLGLSTTGFGCALIEDGARNTCVSICRPIQEHKEKSRNRQWAEMAWCSLQPCGSGGFSSDYADGFKEGYAEYLFRGGEGHPPIVAPLKYRRVKYQTPDGYRAVQDWFEGFRHGAAAARESGAREFVTGPTSLRTGVFTPPMPGDPTALWMKPTQYPALPFTPPIPEAPLVTPTEAPPTERPPFEVYPVPVPGPMLDAGSPHATSRPVSAPMRKMPSAPILNVGFGIPHGEEPEAPVEAISPVNWTTTPLKLRLGIPEVEPSAHKVEALPTVPIQETPPLVATPQVPEPVPEAPMPEAPMQEPTPAPEFPREPTKPMEPEVTPDPIPAPQFPTTPEELPKMPLVPPSILKPMPAVPKIDIEVHQPTPKTVDPVIIHNREPEPGERVGPAQQLHWNRPLIQLGAPRIARPE